MSPERPRIARSRERQPTTTSPAPTRADVICTRAGADSADGLEGNDIIRGGQGDENGGFYTGLCGGDGSDVVKGQQDDDLVEGAGQNDKLYGGQGDDDLGAQTTECFVNEPGNDTLKSRDNVAGNDDVDGGDNTDTCIIDPGDTNANCEQ